MLGEVWLYAQMIFLLDSAYRTDQKARESQRALISEFKFGRILTEQIREEAVKNQTLYLSTLKALADDGHHPYSLYKMFTYFAHDKSFDSNKFGDYLKDRKFDFIWRDIDLPMLDRYFDILKLQSNSESLSELLQSQPEYTQVRSMINFKGSSPSRVRQTRIRKKNYSSKPPLVYRLSIELQEFGRDDG